MNLDMLVAGYQMEKDAAQLLNSLDVYPKIFKIKSYMKIL